MADNIKLHEEINKLLQERQEILEKHSKELSKQISLSHAFIEAQKNDDLDSVIDKYKEMTSALAAANEQIEESSQNQTANMTKLAESVGMGEKGTSALARAVADLTKANALSTKSIAKMSIGLAALLSVIRGVMAQFKSMVNLSISIGKGLFDIGKAIISIPFKIIQGMIDLYFQWWERIRDVIVANEELRDALGDLNSNEGLDTLEGFRNIRGEIASTGLSIGNLFDTMQNNAAVIRHFTELSKGMGAAFTVLGEEMAQSSEYVLAFQKGMGFTAEQMGVVGQRAIAAGREITSELNLIANVSLKMSKRFGISQKLISRDIAEMSSDMTVFGSVGKDSMASLSVFARRLGVDFKKLLGVVNQFDDFETAAENVAKLGQAFGLNIDTIDLMFEQDPGKRVDMIRKAFLEAGRSFESMSRQERNYLAQTAGIDASIADQVFSQKNLSMSYDDIVKSSKAASKQQMTQEEATVLLASSIQRAVVSLERFTNIFGALMNGFIFGITRGKTWNEVMSAIHKNLWRIFDVGRQLGEMFMSLFPGASLSFESIGGMFEKIASAISKTMPVLKQFFIQLGKGDKTAFSELLKSLKGIFVGEGGFEGFLKNEGLRTFVTAVSTIIAMMIDEFRNGLNLLLDFINHQLFPTVGQAPDALSKKMKETGWDKAFAPLSDSLTSLFTDSALGKKIVGTLLTLIEKLVNLVAEELKKRPKLAMTLIGALFGPAILDGLATLLGGVFADLFVKGLMRAVGGKAVTAAAGSALTSAGGAAAIAGVLFNPVAWAILAAAALAAAIVAFTPGFDYFTDMFGDLWDDIKMLAIGAWDFITAIFSGNGKKIEDTFIKLLGSVSAFFVNLFLNHIPRFILGFVQMILNIPPYIVRFITEALAIIMNLIASAFKALGRLLERIPVIGKYIGPAFTAVGRLFSFIGDGFRTVKEWVVVAQDWWNGLFNSIGKWIDKFVSGWNKLLASLDMLPDFVKNGLDIDTSKVTEAATQMAEGIAQPAQAASVAVSDLNDTLKDTRDISMRTKLGDLNPSVLGVKDELTVNRNGNQINIKLDVIMDSNTLAEKLISTKKFVTG